MLRCFKQVFYQTFTEEYQRALMEKLKNIIKFKTIFLTYKHPIISYRPQSTISPQQRAVLSDCRLTEIFKSVGVCFFPVSL